ncbi:IS1380 family transposase [Candidatus Margulisiibacteriota bacterium]
MILTKELSQVTLEKSEENVTGKTGLSFVYHCLKDFGLEDSICEKFSRASKKSNREISPEKKIIASCLSSVAGGERVSDIEILRSDKAFLGSIGWDSMVSPDALHEWMGNARNGARTRQVIEAVSLETMKRSALTEFIYDNDAMYYESDKDSAAYSYHKTREFSGLLGFLPELGICNTVDFRPGNISPCTGIFNQLRKANEQAKSIEKKISACRLDSAGHQEAIFNYCNLEKIRFFISLRKTSAVNDVITAIDEDKWSPLSKNDHQQKTDVEWAENVYVCGKSEAMRVLILRWKKPKPTLFEQDQYCYHVIATNDEKIKPMDWLKFHNGRMGSENYNKELKYGYAADYSPSHDFNQNRTWFLLKILAYNMVEIMKLFYLGKKRNNWNIKQLRYKFIHVCGRIVQHARSTVWRILNVTDQGFNLYRSCQSSIVLQT